MYYLKWNYEEDFLPTCFVWYEQELYENEKEVEEERQTVQRLQESCEVFNGVTKDINKNGFPNLCPPNYKNSQGTYPFYYAKTKELGIIDVLCGKNIILLCLMEKTAMSICMKPPKKTW